MITVKVAQLRDSDFMRKNNINMLEGPLSKNILLYALPVVLSGALQMIYNAADMIVVARWAGGTALAAVGSNTALINLITNFFIGLSVGANIIVGRCYGAKAKDELHKVVHTAMATSVISGLFATLIGLIVARKALILMSAPPEVLDLATLYLRIYFLGMPFVTIYNFGAALLRSIGDSKRPLYVLAVSGVINVALNLVFVIVFNLSVMGVALATVISMIYSAIMVVYYLMKTDDIYKYQIKKTKIYLNSLKEMLLLGFPASIQSCTFSLSNIVIQSTINSFGAAVVSGVAAATTIENLVFVAMDGFYHTCLAFTAQNYGAKNFVRIRKVYKRCLLFVVIAGLSIGLMTIVFSKELLSLFTATASIDVTVLPADIIRYGQIKMNIMGVSFFIAGLMNVTVASLRGLGISWTPMLVSILGVCGIRILWIFTFFNWIGGSLQDLYYSYPISWFMTFAAHFICLMIYRRKKENAENRTCRN